MSLYSVGKPIMKVVFKLFFGFKTISAENFPTDKQVIVVSNHTAMCDPILLGLACKKQLCFMAKAELFKHKLLAKLFGALGAFPVKRGHSDKMGMSSALKVITDGKTLALFPQGTRSKTQDPNSAKPGVALLAAQTGAYVLPCYIYNKSGKVHSFSRNAVIIGEPIPGEFFRSDTVLGYHEKAHELMKIIFELRPKAAAALERKI